MRTPNLIRFRSYTFPGMRPRRNGRSLLGALAGLVMLAFASAFALLFALLIGAAWGIGRLLRPGRRAVASQGPATPTADVLEGEFRVVNASTADRRGLPAR